MCCCSLQSAPPSSMCTDGQWVLSLTDHGAQVTAYHAPTDTVLIADTWPKTEPGALHVYMHALLVDLTSPCVPLLTIPCLVHVFCVRLRQTRSHTLARCVSLALSDTHTFARLTHRVLQSGRHWKGCWRQCRPPTRLRLSLGDFCCYCHRRMSREVSTEVSLRGACTEPTGTVDAGFHLEPVSPLAVCGRSA